MSDDRELTPEQEERVRRLLAEARVDEPIPGDVAGRLDRVLARLADGDPEHEPAEVVVLASRRHRLVTALLVAAAAVVVVGVGAGVVGSRDVSPTADSATSATAADPSDDTLDDTLDSDAAGSVEKAAPLEEPPAVMSEERDTNAYAVGGDATTRIRAAFFAVDVARVRARVAASSLSDGAQAPGAEGSADSSAETAPGDLCEPGAWGPGDLYLVRYAGNHAVLAFRPAVGDTQVVDLLQCGTADILRSVTLPGA